MVVPLSHKVKALDIIIVSLPAFFPTLPPYRPKIIRFVRATRSKTIFLMPSKINSNPNGGYQ
jgi:hypothetical protein